MKRIAIFFLLLSVGLITYTLNNTQQPSKAHKTIKLYTYPKCPYCHDVINFLKRKGWHDRVVLINADDEKNYEILKNLRGDGKDYCPFLVDEIHNKKVADSRKIIDYLKEIFTNSDEI